MTEEVPEFDINRFVKSKDIRTLETKYGVFKYGSLTNEDMVKITRLSDGNEDDFLLLMTYHMLKKGNPTLTLDGWRNFDPLVAQAITVEIGKDSDFRVNQ